MQKYIDLTHKITNEISIFPGDKPPSIKQVANVRDNHHKVSKLSFSSHIGTHIDAPSHFIENGKNLDELDVSYFFGKAYTIDCSYLNEITKAELLAVEDKIRYADFLLFFTGKQYQWGKESYLKNLTVMTKKASIWLSQHQIKGIGADAISHDKIDADASKGETYVHYDFLSREKILIENLNNLDQIVGKFVNFVCLPLYYESSDGSPSRAVAYLDK